MNPALEATHPTTPQLRSYQNQAPVRHRPSSLRLSRVSSATETTDSETYTASTAFGASSSSSTIWGPGALTGKALKALGEAALRGVESFVIRRRLSVLEAYFPHDALSKGEDVEAMYDDLVELSRPDLYDMRTRQRAMRMIVGQVDVGETRQLMQAIAKWPPVEINLFASHFMSAPFSHGFPNSIHAVLLNGKGVFTYRFLLFTCKLAQLNAATCHFLLQLGLLDMILHLCIGKNDRWMTYTSADVLAACSATLRGIWNAYPSTQGIIASHPLCGLWPSHAPLFPLYVQKRTSKLCLKRQAAWRRVAALYVDRRLFALGWDGWGAPGWTREAIDACLDLLEFASGDAYGGKVRKEAEELLRLFLRSEFFRETYRACCEDMGTHSMLLDWEDI